LLVLGDHESQHGLLGLVRYYVLGGVQVQAGPAAGVVRDLQGEEDEPDALVELVGELAEALAMVARRQRGCIDLPPAPLLVFTLEDEKKGKTRKRG
jgi:hypothetical protein